MSGDAKADAKNDKDSATSAAWIAHNPAGAIGNSEVRILGIDKAATGSMTEVLCLVNNGDQRCKAQI